MENETKYITKTIEYLARYFRENYQGEDEANLNSYEYAIEAILTLSEEKHYDVLTGQATYEAFVALLEEVDYWIDTVADEFEKR